MAHTSSFLCSLKFWPCMLALVGLWPSSANSGPTYQMADLEVLAREQNTREYFAHALDIRPSERQAKWRELTGHMGMALLQEAQKERPLSLSTYDLVAQLARWPSLAADEFFVQKRGEYVNLFLKSCFGTHETKACLSRLDNYLAQSKHDPNFILEMMTLLQRKLPQYNREGLLLRLTKGEFAREFCRRDEIQQELESLLLGRALAHFKDRKGSAIPQVSDYLSPECSGPLAAKLRTKLLSPDLNRAHASFLLLGQLQAVKSSDLDQFYSYYLLSGPEVGELFNLSWNHLKLLGSDYERRQQLLKELSKLDPLPGRAFSGEDIRRSRTLAQAFFTHFPEYTNLYLKTCLLYLAGKGEYPRGNPTPSCDHLMMVGRMNKSVSDEVSRQHSALKKFRLLP